MMFTIDERAGDRDRIVISECDVDRANQRPVAWVVYDVRTGELDWWMYDRSGDYAAPVRADFLVVSSTVDDEAALRRLREAISRLREKVAEDVRALPPDVASALREKAAQLDRPAAEPPPWL